ncbi:MAG: hypothetical protein ACKVVP_20790, partial [Chloroflexota bacterium]
SVFAGVELSPEPEDPELEALSPVFFFDSPPSFVDVLASPPSPSPEPLPPSPFAPTVLAPPFRLSVL